MMSLMDRFSHVVAAGIKERLLSIKMGAIINAMFQIAVLQRWLV